MKTKPITRRIWQVPTMVQPEGTAAGLAAAVNACIDRKAHAISFRFDENVIRVQGYAGGTRSERKKVRLMADSGGFNCAQIGENVKMKKSKREETTRESFYEFACPECYTVIGRYTDRLVILRTFGATGPVCKACVSILKACVKEI